MKDLWSEKEIAALKRVYPDSEVSREEILKKINRTWKAIQTKAYHLRLVRVIKKKEKRGDVFTMGRIEDHVF